MGKISNIVEGFTSDIPVNEEWYQKRVSICNGCEFNSLNGATLSLACKTLKNIGCPSEEKGSCNQCCCCIENKALVKAESCPKGKWGAMTVASDKFKVELISEGIVKYNKPTRQANGVIIGGDYIIDLGTVVSDSLQVVFETNSISKQFLYETSKAGCSCTTTFPKEILKGRVYRHSVNIDLSSYGQQTKNLELTFLGSNNNRETVLIKIKFNRKSTKL
jgi:hypothetical protein